ncbi:cobaltochelatase subunit CobN, partial [Salinarimonas sp.]|uniref:cobaltochelatase subunit CobN n=1 Tax=Salinarimonas sp. TaxID=2766526 RepID=UPI00391CC1DA
MHLLPATSVSLDEGEVAIDLDQPPGDVVVLSFADSDLGALAAAHKQRGEGGLSLRLASLRRLRHPLSIDLYLEKTAAHARFVLVRCLGGLDYWRYGLERLFDLATARGIALAVIPGDDRPDPRLLDHSTVPPACCAALEAYFRAGGVENMARLLTGVEAWASGRREAPSPVDAPRGFAFDVSRGVVRVAEALAACDPARPLAHILVYRSAILSGDTAPVAALREALAARDVESIVLAVSSLKDAEAVHVVDEAIRLRRPDVVISTTAFSARESVPESLPAGEGGLASAASKAGWGPCGEYPPNPGPHPTSFGFASEATLPYGEGCALPSL